VFLNKCTLLGGYLGGHFYINACISVVSAVKKFKDNFRKYSPFSHANWDGVGKSGIFAPDFGLVVLKKYWQE